MRSGRYMAYSLLIYLATSNAAVNASSEQVRCGIWATGRALLILC